MRLPVDRRATALAAAATAVMLVLCALLAAPAVADSSGHASDKQENAVEPSPEELRRQKREAERLDKVADQKVATSEQARLRLEELAAEAGRHLETFVVAQQEATAARAQEAAERARHEAAVEVVGEQQATLGRFAAATYRNGSTAGEIAALASLLEARNVTDIGRMAADLQRVGTQQSLALNRMKAARATARNAAAAAAVAARTAGAAEKRAREATERAEQVLAEQDALVVLLDNQAVDALDAAAKAKTKAKQMAKAMLVAALYRAEAERQRRAALGRGEVVPELIGSCKGGDISDFPNGQIDRALLCPLWGAEWHVLRADAAGTFNRMSKAYAEEFGRPICVTDSYRSLELQVDVHKRKPNMTAVPGTSNHGWGTAVDLCDGIENFGTDEFRWMQMNAPRFHWYHPSWAAEGGSREEPWHWEFAA